MYRLLFLLILPALALISCRATIEVPDSGMSVPASSSPNSLSSPEVSDDVQTDQSEHTVETVNFDSEDGSVITVVTQQD
ncbi:MAG: hypothetical protein EBZ49_11635 [Proteobacteria bacterium]|nr:hypothetical protein [Pseudomonadota bacterium]